MAKEVWLPRGYELKGGSKIRSVLCSGEEWQIADTYGSTRVLLALPTLVQKWTDCRLLERSAFSPLPFGEQTFLALESGKNHSLFHIEKGERPQSKADALAFAAALKESRKLAEGVSFHDAIYVEQYSRLLPTWTKTPPLDDETVFGCWLTGGVTLPATNLRRLASLTGWLTIEELLQIVATAGFPAPVDESILISRSSEPCFPQNKTLPPLEKKTALQKESKTFRLSGRPKLEAFFNEHVIDIILHPAAYAAMGINFPSAIILHGPPGCGKTFAVERLVEFLDWPCYSVDAGSVGSPYIHETSRKIAEIFDKAMENAPSVLVIDEMESYLANRQGNTLSGLHHVEEVSEFLRRIPEAGKKKVLVIAMTNVLDMIDPAILRRGRFDHIIEVGMPSHGEVAALVATLLEKLPKTPDLDLNDLIDNLTGKPLSDVAFVIREAARVTAKRGKTLLDQESINEALNEFSECRANDPTAHIGFLV